MRGLIVSLIWLRLVFQSAQALAGPLEGCPNIVLITVDSFRPDRLGCYGYARAHTPNIDRLAARGALFERAFSSANWTNPSLVSMLTGLYPAVHGIERRGVSVPEALVTPMESLRRAGYLVPEINYLFPMPNYLNLGFTPNRIRDLAEFIRTYSDTTFFAWYHFHGPHLPYSPPEKWQKRYLPGLKSGDPAVEAVRKNILMPRGEYSFTARDREVVKALYDAEVAAQDEELAEVFRVLDSLKLRQNTIVVLSADHGEEQFDHGWIGHASTSLSGTLYDELIHIPLILSWPGHIQEGRKIGAPVQGVDVMPTLFGLANLKPGGPMQGVSLEGLLNKEESGKAPRSAVFCECSVCGYQCPDSVQPDWLRAVRTDSWKLIQFTPAGGPPKYSLFDLKSDPGEKADVSPQHPEELQTLKGLLIAHILESAGLRAAITSAALSDSATGADPFEGAQPVEVMFPSEGQGVSWAAHQGSVPVRWTGPEAGDYLLEYRVGQGKYHLEGRFPVRGAGQTFGPFNRVFWLSFPLYNPWSFRVAPKGHPELASPWRNFSFE